MTCQTWKFGKAIRPFSQIWSHLVLTIYFDLYDDPESKKGLL